MRLQYIRLPPAYVPYVLRVSIDAGTPASKNGIFKTNFPLDGGTFGRGRFAERRFVYICATTAVYLTVFVIGYPQTFRNRSELTFPSPMQEPFSTG